MSDLTLSEKIRVRAAICDTVDLSLSREQALAIVKMLEREASLKDQLQSLIADTQALEAKRDKLVVSMGVQCPYFYAASLWIVWFLA